MTVPRLTLRNVELRALSVPLKRPIVSKVGLFDRWPLILIDLHTEEGIVGRSYLEPYLERSVRYLIPAIRDLAEMRKGQRIAPFDDFGTGRARLNLIGLEGFPIQAVAGACSVAGDVAYSLPSRSWIRPARIWRRTAIPTWFGRSAGHAT